MINLACAVTDLLIPSLMLDIIDWDSLKADIIDWNSKKQKNKKDYSVISSLDMSFMTGFSFFFFSFF